MESDMIFLLDAKKAQHKANGRRDRSTSLPPTSYASLFGSSSTPFLSPPRRASFFNTYVERSATTRVHDDDCAFPSPSFL